MVTPLRRVVLDKLARARAVLEDLGRQGDESEFTAVEWQKGYVKALEEILDLEGLSLRQHPRRPTAIPTEIARILLEEGAPGQRGKGTVMDVSLGGCRLATAMELSVGEIIELSFTLLELGTPVTLEGSVRRVQRVGEELTAGVEFKRFLEGVAEAFQAFLALPPSAEKQ